jgi:hypothetical protein
MKRHAAVLPFADGEHARPKTARNTGPNDYGRESYCTPAAKAKLMAQIREEGLPEYISRKTHQRHRHKGVCGLIQNVDFDTVDGGVVTVPMQRPAAILAHAASACAPFAALLRTALAASEGDCLRLVMYMDEVETADLSILSFAKRTLTCFAVIKNCFCLVFAL